MIAKSGIFLDTRYHLFIKNIANTAIIAIFILAQLRTTKVDSRRLTMDRSYPCVAFLLANFRQNNHLKFM